MIQAIFACILFLFSVALWFIFAWIKGLERQVQDIQRSMILQSDINIALHQAIGLLGTPREEADQHLRWNQ